MNLGQPIWREQCAAARTIKERFGTQKALGYLIGEKLLAYLRASNARPDLAADLPRFAAEIKSIFEPYELHAYLSGVRRLGALGHVMGDEQFAEFRAAGAVAEDIVTAAEDVLLVERMKILLLDRA
ncbi:MAG: hypothetical protein IT347_08480 [Candidatus Eisenbacteria bacterium]|nr:hypothetical protein [Candidatus Eisenbacteria bacterium]